MLVPILLPSLLAIPSNPIGRESLLLTDAAVGRREYAVELLVESEKVAIVESATIAERLQRQFTGFRRTRYVVGSASDDAASNFRVGVSDRDLISTNGEGQRGADPRIPLPDFTLPPGDLAPGAEWTASVRWGEKIRCRYVGEETIAGRAALRVQFLRYEGTKPLGTFESSYTLLDRADHLPLQTYIRVKVDFFGPSTVTYRLRRANVPGLGLPR